MGNKNYTKFSKHFNKNKEQNADVIAGQVTIDELINGDSITEVETVAAIVSGCERLNMREKPDKNSNILAILTKNTEVLVNMSESTTEDFYKVTTSSGVEGYCMKNFITVK